MTEDEQLIESFTHATEETEYFREQLQTETDILKNMESELENYINQSLKSKELGYDLTYYSIRIDKLDCDLVKKLKLIDTLKEQMESWKIQADGCKMDLERAGYEFVEWDGPNDLLPGLYPFIKTIKTGWRKKEDTK